jgi:hypothetical protein
VKQFGSLEYGGYTLTLHKKLSFDCLFVVRLRPGRL